MKSEDLNIKRLNDLHWDIANQAQSLSYFSKRECVGIDGALLDEMIALSKSKGNVNVRLCLHPGADSLHHDMVILEWARARYYPPHRHRAEKNETLIALLGELRVFVFDDAGNVVEDVTLSQEGTRLFRIGGGGWHTVIPVSDFAIYHETKPGPFESGKDSEIPDWAPDGSDEQEAEAYVTGLLNGR